MSFRVERLGELLKRDLGEIIQRDFQPDSTFVTITSVRVTPDLSIAKVYLGVFAPERDNEVVFEYINEKVSQIRHKFANRIRNQVRKIPELHFYADDTVDYVNKMEELFKIVDEQPKASTDEEEIMAKAPELASLPIFGTSNLPSNAFDFQTGSILLANKPKGWTSFDVVKYLRGKFKCKKVGHAGTLDPMATGLLILCTGKATKTINQIQDQSKTYRAEITFGGRTASYDAESDIKESAPFDHITLDKIRDAIG